MEAEAILLGPWKNFDDIEENLCINELFKIIEYGSKKNYEDKKFFAAIQGIDIEKGQPKSNDALDKLREKIAKKKGVDPDDISLLRGKRAAEKGFGIGHGLGYMQIDGEGNVTKG